MNCNAREVLTELGCIPDNPIGFVQKFYGIGLSMIGGVSVLFIIFGGYKIIMSRGNVAELNDGKSYISYAIIGLLLAIFGYVFIQIILVNVLHIPGFA